MRRPASRTAWASERLLSRRNAGARVTLYRGYGASKTRARRASKTRAGSTDQVEMP